MSEGRKRRTPQLKNRKRENSVSLGLFIPLGTPVDWMMPTHITHLWFQMLISSGNTPETPSEIMFDQLSGPPLAHSSSHINLTITAPIDTVQTSQLWGTEWGEGGSGVHLRGQTETPGSKLGSSIGDILF